MPSVTTRGVVLHRADYHDNDRMLSLLTPELGRIDVLSRGCRRPKSPLMPASELFVEGEFVLYQNKERYTLTTFALGDTFYPLRLEPYRLTCASYMAAMCNIAAQPNENETALYALLLKGLYLLAYDGGADALGLTTAFLLLFADELGYRPRLTRCAHCRTALNTAGGGRFDVLAGGLCCPDCSSNVALPLSAAQINWMIETLRSGALAPSAAGDRPLFITLRRYVESRLETAPKVSRLLP